MTTEGVANFIVGSGRCGSTMLSSILRAHPQALSLSELFTVVGERVLPRLDEARTGAGFLELLSSPTEDLLALLREAPQLPELLVRGEDALTTAHISPLLLVPLPHLTDDSSVLWSDLARTVTRAGSERVVEHLDALFEWLRQRFARALWIERSGGSLEHVSTLAAAWPSARFVHLVRDGRAAALSMSKHPFFRIKVARALAGRADLPIATCLRAEIPLDRFGAYWSALMLRGARDLLATRSRVLVVRYEALLTAPEQELSRLARFLELDAHDHWLQNAAARVQQSVPRTSELSTSVRLELERACRIGMRVVDRLAA